MKTFVKLYDDILSLDMPMEEKVVLALIRQMTENGAGFWAGYASMSERLGIPKSRCRRWVDALLQGGNISVMNESVGGKSRMVFRTISRD